MNLPEKLKQEIDDALCHGITREEIWEAIVSGYRERGAATPEVAAGIFQILNLARHYIMNNAAPG